MKLSVVIPVFNEESALTSCLETLVGQFADIHEIFVVDNNSTDGSMSIAGDYAARFDNFRVTVEAEQRLIPARNAGFAIASGEIFARTDADTRVADGWARAILDFYEKHSDRFAAGTGVCSFYDMPGQDRFVGRAARIEDAWRSKLDAGKSSVIRGCLDRTCRSWPQPGSRSRGAYLYATTCSRIWTSRCVFER